MVADRRSCSSSRSRRSRAAACSGSASARSCSLLPYRRYLALARAARARSARRSRCCSRSCSRRSHFFDVGARSRVQTGGGSETAHFQVYGFIPHVLHADPLFGLGLNNFSVYYEFVTGKTNWGPHSFYVALIVETGLVGTVALRGLPRAGCSGGSARPARSAARSPRPRDPLAARVRPLAWGCTAALAGTLAANAFYLTMQFYYFYAFLGARARGPASSSRAQRMKVVVLTTSYPRDADDVAGTLRRRRGVEGVRALGVEVDVVSPADFRHFGIAYGGGIAQNLRAAPWRVGARAGVPRRLRARRPARGARRRPRARALDPVGARGARDRQAVRAAGVGDRRRARPARVPWLVRPLVRRARARDRRVGVPRRRGGARSARARCA